MAAVLTVFLLALLAIVVLFVQKAWELRRDRVFLSTVKAQMDVYAAKTKVHLERARLWLEMLPPMLVMRTRQVLRLGALSLAAAARAIEGELHKLADMVSHKRTFQHRESQNEFLKQIHEAKNGNASNGENGTTTV